MALTDGPIAVAPVEPRRHGGGTLDRETAFSRLIDLHLDSAYRLAAVILNDRIEAEDVTHDAIERAWRSFGDLRAPDRFEAWFHRILVNACRDRMRRRRVVVPLDDQREPAASGDAGRHRDPDLVSRTVERDVLERALATLEPDQRIVVALRYFLDLEIEEIAQRLDTPSGTVKSRLHRAIRYLRAAYDAAGRAHPETQP